MSPPVIVMLVLQTFAGLMLLYLLFRLRGHATGVKRPHHGLASQAYENQRADLVTLRDFALQPQFRSERWWLVVLIVLTFSLMVTSRSIHEASHSDPSRVTAWQPPPPTGEPAP